MKCLALIITKVFLRKLFCLVYFFKWFLFLVYLFTFYFDIIFLSNFFIDYDYYISIQFLTEAYIS